MSQPPDYSREPLLTAKLFVPPARQGLVNRPRLLQKMSQSLQTGSRMTLITAPAGYGKTTLALEWAESLGRPFGWLSLDSEDNHPVPFLTYLIAALGQVYEDIQGGLLSERAQPYGLDDADWVQSVLHALVNYLVNSHTPFVLVLDDYHTITDLAVHQAVSFMLEHQPPQMHLVVCSRQDPLLPLARYRSRGQVTEIRLGELRFTEPEAGQFLNESMALGLVPEQVAQLESRTEGWIAGLQLAAISLSEAPAWASEQADPGWRSKFIRDFTGDDRHVVDYLMDEVLSRQPEEIQRFLLYTSVLRRLSGPLCDALLIENGSLTEAASDLPSQPARSPGQTILEYLERANLFIIPLDSRRQWYRYHHLFADLLRGRLQASNPELVPALHSRASRWYEKAGMIDDAVDHALLAEDFERALGLIEESAVTSVWTSGDLLSLLNWFKRLPEDALVTRPRLCLYYGRALFFAGQQLETADRFLDEAERALRIKMPEPEGEVWGLLFTNRAAFAAMRGETHQAIDLVRQAQPLIRDTDYSSLARLGHAEGIAYYLLGALREAETAFERAITAGKNSGNRNLALDCISCLSLTQILSGKLSLAIRACREALEEDPENAGAPAACTVRFALAQGFYEQNNLSAAKEILDYDLAKSRKFGRPHILWQAYLLQARIRHALADQPGALEAMQKAEHAASRFGFQYASRMISACRARLDLVAGDSASAARWAEAYRRPAAPVEPQVPIARDFEELTLARVRVSGNQAAEAVDILDPILETAKSSGQMAIEIEALLLRSVALDKLGKRQEAIETLTTAVQLAEPEGFVRVFLDSGSEFAALLAQARRVKAPISVLSYIAKLLQAFDSQGIEKPGSAAILMGALVEPLSERELEVLRLIAKGLSNPEIAARLYLSVNTLRAHAANIYQKLDVHNRVQAVARAKELGLLKE